MKHPKTRAERRYSSYNKFHNRLKRFNIDKDTPHWAYVYKNTSTPCSCFMCDPHKHNNGKPKFSVRKRQEDKFDDLN